MTTPLADAIDFCGTCENLHVNVDDSNALAEAREICQRCKRDNHGIYKFDAIYTAYQAHMDAIKPNKGKKSTVNKRYGDAIRSLRADGKSQREIAKILQISPTTVNKFLKHYCNNLDVKCNKEV